MEPIARKAISIAAAGSLPLALAVCFYAVEPGVRAFAVVWTAAATAGAWIFARSVSRRISRCTGFVDGILDPAAPRPRLPASDDPVGELARALTRTAPKIEELVSRLSLELARRESILGSMTEAVLAVDARLNITFSNHSFIKIFGDHGVAEGVPLVRAVRDPALIQVLKQAIQSGEALRQRIQLSCAEGRSFELYAAPLPAAAWRGAIAIIRDITPFERLERAKREFVANVSHEFRTPLATIRGYAETLLDGGLEDSVNRRRFVETIQANGVRLNSIAADLLTLLELEEGRPADPPRPISLRDAISNAVRAIEPAAGLREVTLAVGPIPEVSVPGYGIRFEQALLNLLDNAVKFNKTHGEIRVEVTARPDGQVDISIADTGVGIPQEELGRIFERFYRVDKARSRQVGGTGLGLSIVKHAVEQMNGRVAVESEPGKGSRFTITMPASGGHERSERG